MNEDFELDNDDTEVEQEIIDRTYLSSCSEDLLSTLFKTHIFARVEDRLQRVQCCQYQINDDGHIFQVSIDYI